MSLRATPCSPDRGALSTTTALLEKSESHSIRFIWELCPMMYVRLEREADPDQRLLIGNGLRIQKAAGGDRRVTLLCSHSVDFLKGLQWAQMSHL